jgi:hypothetical protein
MRISRCGDDKLALRKDCAAELVEFGPVPLKLAEPWCSRVLMIAIDAKARSTSYTTEAEASRPERHSRSEFGMPPVLPPYSSVVTRTQSPNDRSQSPAEPPGDRNSG